MVAEEGLEPPDTRIMMPLINNENIYKTIVYTLCVKLYVKLLYLTFVKFNCLLSICYKFTDRRFLNKLIINSSAHIRSYT